MGHERLLEGPMSVVAGVDFGTLSVRVSIFDSAKGRLGSGAAEYPLLRKKDDPDYATQSHADHMQALAEAMHRAIESRRHRRQRHRGHRARHHRLDRDPGGRASRAHRRLLPLVRPPRLEGSRRDHRHGPQPGPRSHRLVRRHLLLRVGLCQAAALAAPQSREARPLRHRPRALRHGGRRARAESPTRPRFRAASAPWATSGCGTRRLGGLPPEEFLAAVDPLLAGVRAKLGGRYATSDQIAGAARSGLGGETRPARRHPHSGGRLRRALGRHRRRRAVGRRGQRGGNLHLHHGHRREAGTDPRRLRRGAGVHRSASHRHRSRAFRPRATSSKPSRAAPAPPSPSCRAAWRITAPARPACCASPGTTATAPCW